MNLNKAFIIGRTTAQPELRKTPNGQSVTTFSVATNRVWTDKNGTRQEDTEFHTIVVWGRQAEIASQFLVKGAMVFIEGRLATRSWQDKNGSTHKSTEIICERFQLGPRPQGASQGGYQRSNQNGFAKSEPSGTAQIMPQEEIPIIDLDSAEETKPEDIPF